jgi:hypothetical protein
MGLFRAVNLLQSVEGGYTTGSQLESILSSSPAREAEFGTLLSTRHNSRRMAGNSLTMNAVSESAIAIKVVFEKTTSFNYRPIEAIAKHQVAMISTSTHLESLEKVIDNDVAWSLYNSSSYYETNQINVLCTLIGLDPINYATIASLIQDSSAMGDISTNVRAMKALVVSSTAMSVVVITSAAMNDIASDINAMNIVANNDDAVKLIANSQTALNAITPEARTIVLGIPSALAILANNSGAWEFILSTSTTLDTTIYPLLISLASLDSDTYPTVHDIFADTTASFAVANSKPAMMAIVSEADSVKYTGQSVMDKIILSDNLSTVLGSLVAITELIPDEGIMGSLITNTQAFPILLTSSDAKAAIFTSPTLFGVMMGDSASLASIQSTSQSATVVNDALQGVYKTVGVPGNIIILTAVMGSIVATTLVNRFQGDTQAISEFDIPGTSLSSGPIDVNLPFTNATWDILSIAATAAGNVTITYVDFN